LVSRFLRHFGIPPKRRVKDAHWQCAIKRLAILSGAATNLARLWRNQGKRDEARDLLAPVYNWFIEGFDTPVLQNAKGLLDQLT
jgi:predicted ATPase